jgi:hypothetical protein
VIVLYLRSIPCKLLFLLVWWRRELAIWVLLILFVFIWIFVIIYNKRNQAAKTIIKEVTHSFYHTHTLTLSLTHSLTHSRTHSRQHDPCIRTVNPATVRQDSHSTVCAHKARGESAQNSFHKVVGRAKTDKRDQRQKTGLSCFPADEH